MAALPALDGVVDSNRQAPGEQLGQAGRDEKSVPVVVDAVAEPVDHGEPDKAEAKDSEATKTGTTTAGAGT